MSDLIGDRERRRDAEQRIRNGLLAFAGFLAGHDTAEDVIAAFCPADVDRRRAWRCFADLLFLMDRRGPDRTDPLPHEAEVDLDYMTGARR